MVERPPTKQLHERVKPIEVGIRRGRKKPNQRIDGKPEHDAMHEPLTLVGRGSSDLGRMAGVRR